MKIKFWGTRGSIPTPGKDTVMYGGNTTCLEIISDKGDEYIFDAGTGIRELGNDLLKRYAGKNLEAKLFLSHKHWDHMQGFPFFVPAYIPGNKIDIYSGDAEVTQKDLDLLQSKQDGVETKRYRKDLDERLLKETAKITNKNEENNKSKDVFKYQQKKPYFPVELDQMAADICFKDIVEGFKVVNGVEVSYKLMNHPDGVFCYKIQDGSHSVIFATDYEHDNTVKNVADGDDVKLIAWAKDADILIYDGQYTPESYEKKKGWGHSTYEKGIDIAVEAGVKKLIFTHHDPMSTDEFIKNLEQKANEYFVSKNSNSNLSIEFAKEGNEYLIC